MCFCHPCCPDVCLFSVKLLQLEAVFRKCANGSAVLSTGLHYWMKAGLTLGHLHADVFFLVLLSKPAEAKIAVLSERLPAGGTLVWFLAHLPWPASVIIMCECVCVASVWHSLCVCVACCFCGRINFCLPLCFEKQHNSKSVGLGFFVSNLKHCFVKLCRIILVFGDVNRQNYLDFLASSILLFLLGRHQWPGPCSSTSYWLPWLQG